MSAAGYSSFLHTTLLVGNMFCVMFAAVRLHRKKGQGISADLVSYFVQEATQLKWT